MLGSSFTPLLPRIACLCGAQKVFGLKGSSWNRVVFPVASRTTRLGSRRYKGKGALAVRPIRPTWRSLQGGGIAIERQGTMFVEFAAAVAERQYDWENKLTFALNAIELGTLMECAGSKNEFYHDPGKGGRSEGTVSKTLRVEPTPSGNGYFFSISVSDKSSRRNTNISVPVSFGEFAVMKQLFQYCIPHLLGFDEAFNCPPQFQQPPEWGNDVEAAAGTAP
eukprot:CAMPEP_0177626140 /NCGR_PEP_ID=MMETSP0419_2-20121207/30492_1 /TAXON_ID=582737 /ORGANISM="Tetraselmis sp., Strain GSL018" /LENGTH=221 /DNA_ID=CAMNT_0019127169 /DNA_START=123 /DNA_END=785 /DNA_ORIENTATION=+